MMDTESTTKILSNINPYKLFIYLGFTHSFLKKERNVIRFRRHYVDEITFIPFMDEASRQTKILSYKGTMTDVESVARDLLSLTGNSNLTEIVENVEKVKINFDIPTTTYSYSSLLDYLSTCWSGKERKKGVIMRDGKRLKTLMKLNENQLLKSLFRADSFHYPEKSVSDLDDEDSYNLLICNSKKDFSISENFVTEKNNKLIIESYRVGISKSYLMDVESIFNKSKIIILIDLSNSLTLYWKQKYLELFAIIASKTDNIKIFFDGTPIKINILGFDDFNQKSLRLVRKNNEIKDEWIKNHPDEKFDDVETGMTANSKTKTLSFFLTKETFLKAFEIFKNDNVSLFIS